MGAQISNSVGRVTRYITKLKILASDSENLCSRVRFACKDVIDLRADKWIKTGASVVVKYKTAKEFHAEDRR
jgi:predicted DNA-binding ribbon-helix-helix protein